MKKEINELSSEYLKQLKDKLLKGEITQYEIAHKSFRKTNADWIIKSVDKRKLCITYLCGDTKHFSSYFKLMKEVRIVNASYKAKRRKHITKYYNVINAFTKHRAELKKKLNNSVIKTKSIANRLSPEIVKQLTGNI